MDAAAPLEIRRIVFTGDLLRPFPAAGGGWESATWKNVRWLSHLLGWQLGAATGLPLSRVAWERDGFPTPQVYEALDLCLHPEAWASIFYAETLPDEAEALLVEPFRDALVIGVELPDVMQCALSRNHIPFVDVVAHPVRFMDDLLFAFRTNLPSVHARLLARRFDLERCRPHAALLRAKAAWMPALDLPEGTALVTGQVATDKAVICRARRRFLSLADFTEQIFQLCERHPCVLFKPHPYQGADCPSRRVIEAFGAIRTVTDNFYYLMGQEAITDVYAISSGTVHEAPYFDRRGHAFAGPLYEFGDRPPVDDRAGACLPIDDAFLDPDFWADLLEGVVATRHDLPPGPAPRSSRLRRSLNADWDHGFMDAVVAQPARSVRAAEPATARR
jgi:hypothetical protein